MFNIFKSKDKIKKEEAENKKTLKELIENEFDGHLIITLTEDSFSIEKDQKRKILFGIKEAFVYSPEYFNRVCLVSGAYKGLTGREIKVQEKYNSN